MRPCLVALAALGIAALLPPAITSSEAGVPTRTAQTECASFGAAADFDVFVRGDYRVENNQLQGRAAAGGDVRLRSFAISTALARDAQRLDLIAGGSLDVGNAQANGSVRYGTTLTGSITVPAGGSLAQGTPPFSFEAEMATLELLSAEWAALPQTGTATLQPWGALQLNGTGAGPYVFNLTSAQMLQARSIEFNVPNGATVLVNVSGTAYSTAAAGAYGAGRAGVNAIWNFPLATSVQISGLNWYGTVLAPDATVTAGNGQIYGSIWANAATGQGTVLRAPFTGCLPPPPAPDITLDAICVNPVTNLLKMRARNTGTDERTVEWRDTESAQQGTFVVPAGYDFYFGVADGDAPHRIVATSGRRTATADGVTRECRGEITVRKRVTGTGASPGGSWRITLTGSSGFADAAMLADGESATFRVPGDLQIGAVPIGDVLGGYQYSVTEPDTRGAVASVDVGPVTIIDGEHALVTVGNRFDALPTPTPEPTATPTPDPTPEPTPTPDPGDVVTPPQPTLPPGAPQPLPGPDLVVAGIAQGSDAADLEISETFSRPRVVLGRWVNVTARVRNLGTAPAVGAVGREIPQLEPRHPNRIVEIVSTTRGERCNALRPIRCNLGTVEPGQEVVTRFRAKPLVVGALKSVLTVTSDTPEFNTTNNLSTQGIVVVRPRPRIAAVRVAAPPSTPAGAPVRYRVRVTSGKRVRARFVRLCHRPPRRLLITRAPGTFRHEGRICRDFSLLRKGASAGFSVVAIAAAGAAGDTLTLRAKATAPDLPSPARGRAPLAVTAEHFEGNG